MPQVRALATLRLQRAATTLDRRAVGANESDAAAFTLLAADIRRFLDRPYSKDERPDAVTIPPGAPIGTPALDFLDRYLAPECSWKPE
jgi:hypothetical protein